MNQLESLFSELREFFADILFLFGVIVIERVIWLDEDVLEDIPKRILVDNLGKAICYEV